MNKNALEEDSSSDMEDQEESDDRFLTTFVFERGVSVIQETVLRRLEAYTKNGLRDAIYGLQLTNVNRYACGSVGGQKDRVRFETEDHFRKWERKAGYRARQNFWIAGRFGEEEKTEVYYGRVTDVFRIAVRYRKSSEQMFVERVYYLVEVKWQYGIIFDSVSRMPFVRKGRGSLRGSIRNWQQSIENMRCINRLIRYFDDKERRYFLDIERYNLQCDANEKLCGVDYGNAN